MKSINYATTSASIFDDQALTENYIHNFSASENSPENWNKKKKTKKIEN